MHDILGYQPTVGELIVATVLAILAAIVVGPLVGPLGDKFYKFTSRIRTGIADKIAARSRISREKQINKLELQLHIFMEQIKKPHIQVMTQANEIARAIALLVFGVSLLIVRNSMIIVAYMQYIFNQLHVELSDMDRIFLFGTGNFEVNKTIISCINAFCVVVFLLLLLISGKFFGNSGRFLRADDEVRTLEARISVLKAKNIQDPVEPDSLG